MVGRVPDAVDLDDAAGEAAATAQQVDAVVGEPALLPGRLPLHQGHTKATLGHRPGGVLARRAVADHDHVIVGAHSVSAVS